MDIVITGVSRGIGFALAKKFLKEGHTVFGSARKADAEGLLRLQETYPSSFIPFVVDVSDTTSIARAKTQLEAHCSVIDILVNNAGIYLGHELDSFKNVDSDAILTSFTCNALGSFRFTQALYPLLQGSEAARVCNISSVIGSIAFQSAQHEYAYTTSKAALNMLTRLMQLQLKKDGITVCAMHPGWVQTDMGGPQAPLTPAESAEGLYTQILNWSNDDHPFIDYLGKKIPW